MCLHDDKIKNIEMEENNMDEKVMKAIHRIEDLYFSANGECIVSFSGGKDSTVLLALIKMSIDSMVLPPEGIKAVFVNTGIELGATVDFVKWCKNSWYQNIEIIRPEKPFKWVLDHYGKPMKSKMKSEFLGRYHKGNRTETTMSYLVYGKNRQGKQYARTKLADRDFHMIHPDFTITASAKCCDILKKKSFKKYAKDNGVKGEITGVRTSEGGARALAYEKRASKGKKHCTFVKGGVIYKTPIYDWTDEDVDRFIEKYNVPLSRAYTEYGMERTGCMGCPFARDVDKDLKVLHDYEPNRYKASMSFLKDVYIAQNVELPFDEEYEAERKQMWNEHYYRMRNDMLKEYRPQSRLIKKYEESTIYDFITDKGDEKNANGRLHI